MSNDTTKNICNAPKFSCMNICLVHVPTKDLGCISYHVNNLQLHFTSTALKFLLNSVVQFV